MRRTTELALGLDGVGVPVTTLADVFGRQGDVGVNLGVFAVGGAQLQLGVLRNQLSAALRNIVDAAGNVYNTRTLSYWSVRQEVSVMYWHTKSVQSTFSFKVATLHKDSI